MLKFVKLSLKCPVVCIFIHICVMIMGTCFLVSVKPFFIDNPSTISVSVNGNDVGLGSHVSGCPLSITITCTVSGRDPLMSNVVVNNTTPVIWQRASFTDGLIGGSSEATCMARNSAGQSVRSVRLTVMYGNHPNLALAVAMPIVIAVVIIVLVIVIVVVVVAVKKKK
jgi:hypothetical protein